jgi:hypothetical protein
VQAKRGDKIIASFNVAQGGFLDIDIKVRCASGARSWD